MVFLLVDIHLDNAAMDLGLLVKSELFADPGIKADVVFGRRQEIFIKPGKELDGLFHLIRYDSDQLVVPEVVDLLLRASHHHH